MVSGNISCLEFRAPRIVFQEVSMAELVRAKEDTITGYQGRISILGEITTEQGVLLSNLILFAGFKFG